jgi:putative ABC transport system permease protein
MTTIWRKAFRDVWQERMRTLLVILSIALGVAAFESVMSAYSVLTRELDRGYLATNPASAVFRTDPIDDKLVSDVLANPAVSDAEPRRVVGGQIKTGPMQWRPLMLFVVKDYGDIRVSKLEPQEGAWPPANGEILIERDAFQVAHARIGDTITLKTLNGKEQSLRVSGSVHDVGQAQARMENIVYGYITLATLKQLGEEPYLDQLNILVAQNRFDENHIREVTASVRQLIEANGHEVRRVDIPKPGKHPHSDLTGVLLLSMSSFGLFVLVLSGILVVNLLTATMASQVRQVGMMKAVGGTRLGICRVYMVQALVLGLMATVIALPLGLLGNRLLCRYMAYFLNFDINSFSAPLWVYLLVVLVGIISPLIAAVYPIWRGSGVSVREALSDFGVSQTAFGSHLFDHILTKLSSGSRLVLLSIRNSFRRRARLILTMLTLSAGGLFFMTALNVRASMINTLDQLFAARKFDLSVGFLGPQPMAKLENAIRKTPGITRYEGWFTTEGSLIDSTKSESANDPHSGNGGIHDSGAPRSRFNVVAMPADTQLLKLNLIEGRGLQTSDNDALVINDALAKREPQLKVGSTVTMQMGPAATTWRIVGITRETFSPAVAYAPLNFFSERHPGMVNSLRLALDKTDPDSIDLTKALLDQNLEAEGIRARGSLSTADSRFGFDQHMLMIYVFLIIMSVIVGGVGTLGLMTTMSLNIMERRREIAVMRAIGATAGIVSLIVIVEGIAVGLMSWTIAAIAAWPVSRGLGNLMVRLLFTNGLHFKFEWWGLLIWLVASLAASLVATLIPAWKTSRTTIREGLAYE